MKILVAGAVAYPIYEEAFLEALRDLGHSAEGLSWCGNFHGLVGKVQYRLPAMSPASLSLNRALRHSVKRVRPDVVLVWRGTHVAPSTYRFIKQQSDTLIVSYNNDDPFGPSVHSHAPWHHRFLWRWYLKSLPLTDLALVFRPINVEEALSAGAKRAAVMKPYFIPGKDRPIALSDSDQERFGCDVVFAGHYEPDGRERYLNALVHAGLHVRLFGGKYWTRDVLGDAAEYFGPVQPALGEDYTKALCGAQMCLCFLSRLNRDEYTRRCFEIPACGSLLLSERTVALQSLFREGEEAVFFSNVDELVEKALWLKDHPGEIDRIAEAGRCRVHADGHSINDRARQFLETVERVRHASHC